MMGRHALIAARARTGHAEALAALLAAPHQGAFAVEWAHDEDGVSAFLGAREPGDAVLVHSDGVRIDPAALAACSGTDVLVLATDARLAPEGCTVIAGAPTAAVVRALRDGRADGDNDGLITARELHHRLAQTQRLRWSGDLDTAFVVAGTDRATRLRRRRRLAVGGALVMRAGALAGSVALLASLSMAWLFGETGLAYALGAGTPWPARIAPLLCLLAALAGGVYAATGRGDAAIPVLVVATFGALLALQGRFADPENGPGISLAVGGLTLLLLGSRVAGDQDADGVGFACACAGVLCFQLVGPRGWHWIALACAGLAAAAWRARRHVVPA